MTRRIADPVAAARIRDAAKRLAGQRAVDARLRLATVVSHDAGGTMTVLLGGVGDPIPGVRRAAGAWLPPPGAGVWLAGQRPDLWAITSTDPTCGLSAHISRGTTQSIPDSTSTTITWTGIDPTPDPFGLWSSGTDVIIPATGRYKLDAYVAFSQSSNGRRSVWVTTGGTERARTTLPPATGDDTQMPVSVPARSIIAGNAVQVRVYQNNGSAINVTGAHLSVVYLGP